MKFAPLASVASLVAVAFGQGVIITLPTGGANVSAGSNFLVDITRPNSLSGSEEVAVVIALQSCAARACSPPSDVLGSILYNGPFNPQAPNPNPDHQQLNQNFTVQVPSGFQSGSALLSVTHVALIGAGPAPWIQYQNVTVNVG
ncbi:hypothetical protein BV22DRAFT_1132822 [Leucogyrophana mollusca]|uniref:Uncharacterized protein n=1 Tax=Leucogyrophana mollusca TaxID=85980 RepID=A0ACB8B7M0_9AGAM|nr:hypothetical protein BV22DRAFT_1132822 [Leucogyrophana mollusca]